MTSWRPRGPVHTFHAHEVFRDLPMVASSGPSREQVPHGHDFLELEVVRGGSATHIAAQGRRTVTRGDLVVLRPGTWHGYEDCQDFSISFLAIAASAFDGELAFLRDMPTLHDLLWQRPVAPGNFGVATFNMESARLPGVLDHLDALQTDLTRWPASRPVAVGRLMTALGLIAEDLDTGEVAPHPAVAAVLSALRSTPEQDWSLDELGRIVSLDPVYLTRLFRQHVGLPPISYLATIRAERAALLLTATAEPVSHIGAQVGWADPAYFTRRFKSLTGVTPTGYRKRVRPRGV